MASEDELINRIAEAVAARVGGKVCPKCRSVPIVGGVCAACDGQYRLLAYEIAAALGVIGSPAQRGSSGPAASEFGSKAILKFGPTNAEVNSGIVQQQTLFAWSSPDGQPHDVTVELGRIAAGGGGTFPNAKNSAGVNLGYRFNAQVLLGTPGAMQDPFFVDLNRGQRFTASASYVAVTAQALPPPPGFAAGSMVVYGALGYGPCPTLAPIVSTLYIDNLIAGGLSSMLVIPPRANFIQPVRSSDLNNLITMTFFDPSGTVDDALQFANGQMVLAAPISGETYTVQLTNGGAVTASYNLVFQLSI